MNDKDTLPAQPCARCKAAPSAGICCSSHSKHLCHRCYRRSHFVEVCTAGCGACIAEGLPVVLLAKDAQPAPVAPIPDARAIAARLDQVTSTLRSLIEALEFTRMWLVPPEVPSGVESHEIGTRHD